MNSEDALSSASGEDDTEAEGGIHVSTQTDVCQLQLEEIADLQTKVISLEKKLEKAKFRLDSIKDDDGKISFYTGFPLFLTLKAFYTFLGPSVENLKYSKKQEELDIRSSIEKKHLHQRSLPPMEEFFMTLVRLRLGLVEQDLADRFGVSQSTVSRITCTWINFLFVKLKELPLWPPRDMVRGNMPQQFRAKYPKTRVVLNATEIYIEQPHLHELPKM